jgi:hypothetical protein
MLFKHLMRRGVACLLLSFCWVLPASAQSETDFIAAFAGEWKIFEPSFGADGGQCALVLSKDTEGSAYKLEKAHCGGELAQVASWGIADAQLALLDGSGGVLARMGGNQRRMTGTTVGGNPVIFDRVGVKGLADQLQAAVKASGCYYVGFGKQCATDADLANPGPVGTQGETKVKVVTNLNVRAEARDDAGVVGIVPQNSCISVNHCLSASDGVWCRAQFGEKQAWLHKLALRRNKWPIVTFINKCDN